MKDNKNKSRSEVSASEDNIPQVPTIAGVIEMALLHASLRTLIAIKLKQAARQMRLGEPVHATVVLINDESQKQVVLEGYTKGAGDLFAFEKELCAAIVAIDASRSIYGFPLAGAKHLLSSTEEALVFKSDSLSERSIAVAVPIVRSHSGDFLGYGDEFAIDWNPALLLHAFGVLENNEESPSQDPLNGRLWGNN